MVREFALPPEARELTTLPRLDYHDCFLVDDVRRSDRTPEQWARALVGGAPPKMQRTLRTAWLTLGLKLGPADDEQLVLGWPVRLSTDDHVLLSADSRAGFSAELLLKLEPPGLLFATFIQLHNALGRGLWALITPGHQRTVAYVLERGTRPRRRASEPPRTAASGPERPSARARRGRGSGSPSPRPGP
jgi:hypothetical protein